MLLEATLKALGELFASTYRAYKHFCQEAASCTLQLGACRGAQPCIESAAYQRMVS